MSGLGGHYTNWNNHKEKDKYCMLSPKKCNKLVTDYNDKKEAD